MSKLYSNARRPAFAAAIVLALACSDNPVDTKPALGSLSLNIVSGNGQSALANTELPDPLVVQVLNDRGRPVRDQIVNFRVTSGGGSVFAGASITNSDGMAMEWWTLGESGAQSVEVRAVDPTTGAKQVFGTFTATITPPPPPPVSADSWEPNDTQGSRQVGALRDGDSHGLVSNFHTLTDVDWFRYDVLDGSNPGCGTFSLSEEFTFRSTLTNVPAGSTYRVSIFSGATLVAQQTVGGGGSATAIYSYSGSCVTNNDRSIDIRVERLAGDLSATMYSLNSSATEQ